MREDALGDLTVAPDKRKRKRKRIPVSLDDAWERVAVHISTSSEVFRWSLTEIWTYIFKQKKILLHEPLSMEEFRQELLAHRTFFHLVESIQPQLPTSGDIAVGDDSGGKGGRRGAKVETCKCHLSQSNACCDSTSCMLPHVLYYQPAHKAVERGDEDISPDLFLIELADDESFLKI